MVAKNSLSQTSYQKGRLRCYKILRVTYQKESWDAAKILRANYLEGKARAEFVVAYSENQILTPPFSLLRVLRGVVRRLRRLLNI